jgi:hypothetical protein
MKAVIGAAIALTVVAIARAPTTPMRSLDALPDVRQVQDAKEPSSYTLIDRALEARRITEELAHKYRVFAAYGDSRLPAEFRGAASGRPEPPPEVAAVGEALPSLSAATQAELAPFFMRPDEPGSWITLGSVNGQSSPGDAPPEAGGAASPASVHAAAARASIGVATRRHASSSRVTRRETPRVRATQSAWVKFPAVGGKAKVWAQARYPGDAAKARAIANALTNHIWKTLVDYMGLEPAADSNIARNGGDPAIDFYLVHAPTEVDRRSGKRHATWIGRTVEAISFGPCFPQQYILLDSNQPLGGETSPGLLQVATHELMHAITLRFRAIDRKGCGARWIMEASAVWAENLVYPRANGEHAYGRDVLNSPYYSIDDEAELSGSVCRCYGVYLFPLFQQWAGKSSFVRDIWNQFRSQRALPAINNVLTGGWDKQWPEFLIRHWNRPPIDGKSYHKWDNLADPSLQETHDVSVANGPDTIQLEMPGHHGSGTGRAAGLDYLSGWYWYFKFEPNVHTVTFENTLAPIKQEHASVWAILKTRAGWQQPEDWTKDYRKSFCRDIPSEDVSEMVIIVGNSDWETKKPLHPPEPLQLVAYPQGCAAWEGIDSSTYTLQSRDPAVSISEIVVANVHFESDSGYIVPGEPRGFWKLTKGDATWKATLSGMCSGSGSGSVALAGLGPDEEVPRLQIWSEGKDLLYSGQGSPWPGEIPRYPSICPNGPGSNWNLTLALGWWVTDGVNNKVSADGRTIRGSFSDSTVSGGAIAKTTHSYTLRLKY